MPLITDPSWDPESERRKIVTLELLHPETTEAPRILERLRETTRQKAGLAVPDATESRRYGRQYDARVRKGPVSLETMFGLNDPSLAARNIESTEAAEAAAQASARIAGHERALQSAFRALLREVGAPIEAEALAPGEGANLGSSPTVRDLDHFETILGLVKTIAQDKRLAGASYPAEETAIILNRVRDQLLGEALDGYHRQALLDEVSDPEQQAVREYAALTDTLVDLFARHEAKKRGSNEAFAPRRGGTYSLVAHVTGDPNQPPQTMWRNEWRPNDPSGERRAGHSTMEALLEARRREGKQILR